MCQPCQRSCDRRGQYTGRVVERYLGPAPNNDAPQANFRSACTMAIGGMRGAKEEPGTLPQFKALNAGKSEISWLRGFPRPNAKIVMAITVEHQRRRIDHQCG